VLHNEQLLFSKAALQQPTNTHWTNTCMPTPWAAVAVVCLLQDIERARAGLKAAGYTL
jgi:hypothetical protein